MLELVLGNARPGGGEIFATVGFDKEFGTTAALTDAGEVVVESGV
jgi:hypothetical protein